MDNVIRINIVGDFCIKETQNLQFGKELDSMLAISDLNIVNFEAPIYTNHSQPSSKSGPCLFQAPDAPKLLEKHHFNIISLANNHIMDYGVEALENTINAFTQAKTIGAGSYDDIYKIHVFHVKGRKIGVLCITQYEFGILPEKSFHKPQAKGTAWMCHPSIDELIVNAHQLCDTLIVIPHAGLENFEYPLPEIKALYRHFIALGADAVIGGHPHIPQPWEIYKNKPIVYSIGNFCFDKIFNKKFWNQGLLASLEIEENKIHLQVKQIQYDYETHIVNFSNDSSFDTFCNLINQNFINEEQYISIVNKKCLSLQQWYQKLFEYSGFFRPSIKKYLRIILSMIKRKYILKQELTFDNTHFINNIRCETHRWVISRIYELNRGK